ncbi:MAG: NADAR family protein [Clostridiales bacterium]|nr:NADAR family protein [Clostridiales bacterium]MBR4820071.1 NADAR family protein [Clostridiales bacterium]
MKNEIIGFHREYEDNGCFCNWYPAEFDYAGRHYLHSEQFMMYQKVMMFGQTALGDEIMRTADPEQCKILGREFFDGFDAALWKRTRFVVVKRGIRAKFSQNPSMMETLLATGNAILAECSPRDKDWGILLSTSDPEVQDITKWRGENLLGQVLMEVREELREEIRVTENGEVLPYEDSKEKEPIPEWELLPGELIRIPQFKNTVLAYTDTIGCVSGSEESRQAFFFERSFADWEALIKGGMAASHGLPIAGFYEMKQDIYDISRRLDNASGEYDEDEEE